MGDEEVYNNNALEMCEKYISKLREKQLNYSIQVVKYSQIRRRYIGADSKIYQHKKMIRQNRPKVWRKTKLIYFDLTKYILLYYFKKIIENQIGVGIKNNKLDFNKTLKEKISDVDEEIESYLGNIYPKSKLVDNVVNAPIYSQNIDFMLLQKKSLFDLFKKDKQYFCISEIEEKLFKDSDYFINYLRLNKNNDLPEFDLISKLSIVDITENLVYILSCIRQKTVEKLNGKNIYLSQNKLCKRTNDVALFMDECVKSLFKEKLDIYILNEKISLIDEQILKTQSLDKEYFDKIRGKRQSMLNRIEGMMQELVFYDEILKFKIDKYIEEYVCRIYDNSLYDMNLKEVICSIGEDLFLNLVRNTESDVYLNNKVQLISQLKNTYICKVNSNDLIKISNVTMVIK